MRVGGAAKLFAYRALWRAGSLSAGRALVRALGSTDENLRTIAGMFLVKAGSDSEKLLHEALSRRENIPMVLTVLADIGDSRLEPEIRAFSQDLDPNVAKAAREALRVLAQASRGSR